MPAIDHATVAGENHETLDRFVMALGFDPGYGGAHANDEIIEWFDPDGTSLGRFGVER